MGEDCGGGLGKGGPGTIWEKDSGGHLEKEVKGHGGEDCTSGALGEGKLGAYRDWEPQPRTQGEKCGGPGGVKQPEFTVVNSVQKRVETLKKLKCFKP